MFREYEEKKKVWLSIMEKWNQKKNVLRKSLGEKANFNYEHMEMEREIFDEFRDDIHNIMNNIKEKYGEKTLFMFLCSVDYRTQDGEWEWVEGIGAIDKSIVSIIIQLNELGYQTKFCCSGVRSEHKNKNKNKIREGYIMFQCHDSKRKEMIRRAAFKTRMLVEFKTDNIHKEREIIREEYVTIRNQRKFDWQTKKTWKKFMKEIEKITNKAENK